MNFTIIWLYLRLSLYMKYKSIYKKKSKKHVENYSH